MTLLDIEQTLENKQAAAEEAETRVFNVVLKTIN